MAVKSPTTYGDYYWAMQVEARKLFAEEEEKELAGMAARLISRLRVHEYMPEELASLFDEIAAPAGQFMSGVGGRFISEIADGAISKGIAPVLDSAGYAAYKLFPARRIAPTVSGSQFFRKKIEPDFFESRFLMHGYDKYEGKFFYDSMRPYPSIPDFVTYSRYHGEPKAPWGEIFKWVDIDPRDWPVWKWLGMQRLTTVQLQTLYKRKAIEKEPFETELAKVGWSDTDIGYMERLAWTMPNAMLMVQGGLMAELPDDQLIADISLADIKPDYAQRYLDAVLTKPSTSDIIAYELRTDPQLSDLPAKLRKTGVHSAYWPLYRELAHIIPPTGDLITMAVREAFTPAIAARFGQYEDFPAEFAHWAAKKGLTEEWAQRYWAAHWTLPSATQGFEMLHRGVIGTEELNMLLRALDIMPFWRDKLTSVAYKRLTRVDIRRMYRVGVLDEEGVYAANLELGYNERDSKRMTEFTVKQTLQTLSKFTSRDVIAAYTKRMIDRSDARGLLSMLGVKGRDIDFILSTADYKRAWEFTEDRITGIRNLYKKLVYDENTARAELLRLDLPSDQVDVLMKQWYYDREAKVPRRWTTAQTLSFAKAELITPERAKAELYAIGWDTEHIDVFVRSIE